MQAIPTYRTWPKILTRLEEITLLLQQHHTVFRTAHMDLKMHNNSFFQPKHYEISQGESGQ